MNRKELVKRLKYMIKSVAPNSQTILYGSEARGEAKQNSDIDILILVDKDTVSPMEEDVITAPIYDLEIETGTIISPIVMTRKAWEAAKRKTVFYYNVMKDGVLEGYGTPQEVLTSELIKRIYQVDSEVVNDSCGKMHILFL